MLQIFSKAGPAIPPREWIAVFFQSIANPLKKNINSWNWKYWLFFYGFIPLVLLSIAQLPQGLKENYCILDISNPTLFTLYLSNFTHSEIIHISSNIAVYLIFMTIIFLFESRKENLKYLSAGFLTILPFFISMLSIFFLGSINQPIPLSQGFSGILAAYIGYGSFLFAKFTYDLLVRPFIQYWNSIKTGIKIVGMIYLALICVILMYVLNIGYNLGQFTANEGALTNGIAHFGGFIIGIICPMILGIIHDWKSRSNLVFSSIFSLYVVIVVFRYYKYLIEILP